MKDADRDKDGRGITTLTTLDDVVREKGCWWRPRITCSLETYLKWRGEERAPAHD